MGGPRVRTGGATSNPRCQIDRPEIPPCSPSPRQQLPIAPTEEREANSTDPEGCDAWVIGEEFAEREGESLHFEDIASRRIGECVHPKNRWNHDAPNFNGPRVSREGAETRRGRDEIRAASLLRSSSLLRAFVPSCEALKQLPRTDTDFLDARTYECVCIKEVGRKFTTAAE